MAISYFMYTRLIIVKDSWSTKDIHIIILFHITHFG